MPLTTTLRHIFAAEAWPIAVEYATVPVRPSAWNAVTQLLCMRATEEHRRGRALRSDRRHHGRLDVPAAARFDHRARLGSGRGRDRVEIEVNAARFQTGAAVLAASTHWAAVTAEMTRSEPRSASAGADAARTRVEAIARAGALDATGNRISQAARASPSCPARSAARVWPTSPKPSRQMFRKRFMTCPRDGKERRPGHP